jgi:hypothetical protein
VETLSKIFGTELLDGSNFPILELLVGSRAGELVAVKNKKELVFAMSDERQMCFPLLVAMGGVLLKTTKREFIRYDLSDYFGGILVLKNASNPKTERHFILTSDGRFWRIERIGTKRGFLRWLAPVWDFTLAECRLEHGQQLTTDELLKHVEPLKSPSGFPTASHLKGFLRKRLGQVFDAAMFKEFWQKHCFELKPPDSWGEILELK